MSMRDRLTGAWRRWRVRRYERAQLMQVLRDERAEGHTRRQQAGIRDVSPPVG